MMSGLALYAIIYGVLTIGVVLLPMILLVAHRTRIWGVAYMILYVGVYLVLTLKGNYVAPRHFKHFGGAGDVRVKVDHFWWCPLTCGIGSDVDRLSGRLIQEESLTAVFFWPLLSLDRAVIHPDLLSQP